MTTEKTPLQPKRKPWYACCSRSSSPPSVPPPQYVCPLVEQLADAQADYFSTRYEEEWQFLQEQMLDYAGQGKTMITTHAFLNKDKDVLQEIYDTLIGPVNRLPAAWITWEETTQKNKHCWYLCIRLRPLPTVEP